MNMTRRDALKTTLAAAAGAATLTGWSPLPAAPAAAQAAPFALPPLPYAFDALEPHIDARTMEIHHDKHHAAYVTNLNKALAQAPTLSGKPLHELLRNLDIVPENLRAAVRNNGGGHFNHSLFWEMMRKGGGGQPGGELAQAIDQTFGNFAGFRQQFTEAATRVFGSGWAWLVADGKQLKIEATPNQDTPVMRGENQLPLLGLDVWEHAYYLKYQNRRPDYIQAWFDVINWDFVAERWNRALKG